MNDSKKMNDSKRSQTKKTRQEIEKDNSERILYQDYDIPAPSHDLGIMAFPSLFPQIPLLDLDRLAYQHDIVHEIHKSGDNPLDFIESEYNELESKPLLICKQPEIY